MTNRQKTIQDEMHKRLEQIEIDAWISIYNSINNEIDKDWESKINQGAFLSFAPGYDILALNKIIGLGILSYPSNKLIENIKSEYQQRNIPRLFAQVYTEGDESIEAQLTQAGFIHRNNWVKLYSDCSPVKNVNCNFEIRKISKNEADVFGEVITTAFDWSTDLKPYFCATIDKPGWFHYATFDREKPVGTASMFIKGNTAWIGFGATLPEARGQGAQTALTAARINDASRLGVEHIAVETAEDRPDHSVPSYRNMIRCGFKNAYIRPNYLLEL